MVQSFPPSPIALPPCPWKLPRRLAHVPVVRPREVPGRCAPGWAAGRLVARSPFTNLVLRDPSRDFPIRSPRLIYLLSGEPLYGGARSSVRSLRPLAAFGFYEHLPSLPSFVRVARSLRTFTRACLVMDTHHRPCLKKNPKSPCNFPWQGLNCHFGIALLSCWSPSGFDFCTFC